MPTNLDFLSVVDKMMAASKLVAVPDSPPEWSKAWSEREPQAKLPLVIDGEVGLAQLLVVGRPDSPDLQFRLGILMFGCICRLDYTDEWHANSYAEGSDGLPPLVKGPHYHSWPRNRRFFRGLTAAPALRNAEPFEMMPSFDSALRWFCAETNILPLPHDHRIQLPLRTRLI